MNVMTSEEISNVPGKDVEMLGRYLANLEEHSDNTFKAAKVAILNCFYPTTKKSIIDLNIDDCRNVIKALQALDVMDSSKASYYIYIHAWVNRVKTELSAKDIETKNYFDCIPDNPFRVSNKKKRPDSMKVNTSFDDEEDTKALTDEQVTTILRLAQYEPRWFEIFLKVQKETVFRISETISIRIENINFETGIIASGVVKNHCKEGVTIAPVSRELLTDIKSYMNLLKKDEEWLFPAKQGGDFTDPHVLMHIISKFSRKCGFKFTSHQFRHTASKKMLMKGVSEDIRGILTNHATGSSVESRVYAHGNITNKDRVDLYNKYHA